MSYKLHNPHAFDRIHPVDRPIWENLLEDWAGDCERELDYFRSDPEPQPLRPDYGHNMRVRARRHKEWLPDEDQTLRDEYPTRETWMIARQLGRSVHSVIGRAYRLGLSKRK